MKFDVTNKLLRVYILYKIYINLFFPFLLGFKVLKDFCFSYQLKRISAHWWRWWIWRIVWVTIKRTVWFVGSTSTCIKFSFGSFLFFNNVFFHFLFPYPNCNYRRLNMPFFSIPIVFTIRLNFKKIIILCNTYCLF